MFELPPISGHFTGYIHYKVSILDIQMNIRAELQDGLGAHIRLPLVTQAVGNQQALAIGNGIVDLILDTNKIDLQLDGNWISQIAGAFMTVLHHRVLADAVNLVNGLLPGIVQTSLNPLLSQTAAIDLGI